MQQDNVISALVGLVGACNNNAKTANTDELILRALNCANCNDAELVRQIREEKYRISPGCATCSAPCGNTSDYDMRRIYNADAVIAHLKLQVIAEIRQLARAIVKSGSEATDNQTSLICKSLSYVGYDLQEQTLLALIEEITNEKLQIEGKI